MSSELKIIGAVGVKVRPDTGGFRRDAERGIEEELRGVDGEVPVKPVVEPIDRGEVRREVHEATIEGQAEADAHPIRVPVETDRNRLEEELGTINDGKVKRLRIEFVPDHAGLMRAKAELEAALGFKKTIVIEPELNKAALARELATVNAALAANRLEQETRRAADAFVRKAEKEAATFQRELAGARARAFNTIGNALQKVGYGAGFAVAKLTGLRAAWNWTKGFFEELGNLDRKLPIVAAIATGIGSISSAVLQLGANLFSIGNDLGAFLGSLAMLSPAAIAGLADVFIVLTGTLGGFFKALGGDTKALKMLPDATKQAIKELKPLWDGIANDMSHSFWTGADDGLQAFIKKGLPALGKGWANLGDSMGHGLGTFLGAFAKAGDNGQLDAYFGNLTKGFDNANKNAGRFWDAIIKLGTAGSEMFPRLGNAFSDMSVKFDNWVDKRIADGSMTRWIDDAAQGFKDLWNIGTDVIHVWGNIGDIAQRNGAMTLHTLADLMDRFDAFTQSHDFDVYLSRILTGARTGMDEIYAGFKGISAQSYADAATMIQVFLEGAGSAAKGVIGIVGSILSDPAVTSGVYDFFLGVGKMLKDLEPAAKPIADIIGTLGKLLGAIASDVGPLFLAVFQGIDGVFSASVDALTPFLPQLTDIGKQVVEKIAPGVESLAKDFLPKFAQVIIDNGPGIVDVFDKLGKLLSDMGPALDKLMDFLNSGAFQEALKNTGKIIDGVDALVNPDGKNAKDHNEKNNRNPDGSLKAPTLPKDWNDLWSRLDPAQASKVAESTDRVAGAIRNVDAAAVASAGSVATLTNTSNTWAQGDYTAQLKALPDDAQRTLQILTGMTWDQWKGADWTAVMKAAQNVPGLPAVIAQMIGATDNNGFGYAAIIKAIQDGSIEEAKRALDDAARNRMAVLTAQWKEVGRPAGLAAMQDGIDIPGSRNGSILDALGRGIAGFNAERMRMKFFANGGFENHVAQITKPGGPVRVWSEPETFGEAYIPLAASKRGRSVSILAQVASMFGYSLSKASAFANGGVSGGSRSGPSAFHVNIGDFHNHSSNTPEDFGRAVMRDVKASGGNFNPWG